MKKRNALGTTVAVTCACTLAASAAAMAQSTYSGGQPHMLTPAIMPPGAPMFGYTKEQTVIQLSGTGPWGLNYLNPTDDPRKKTAD